MDERMTKDDWIFLCMCLFLGVLTEWSFFHEPIGMSYIVFITAFYVVFFFRFRLTLHHRRIGMLLIASIWILSGTYMLYERPLFNALHMLLIPLLVLFHIVLLTSANTTNWNTPRFLTFMMQQLRSGITYSISFCSSMIKQAGKDASKQTKHIFKHVLIGLVIAIPLLFVIIRLLMSADDTFKQVILRIPLFSVEMNVWTSLLRIFFIAGFTLFLFGLFQMLRKNRDEKQVHTVEQASKFSINRITALTLLILINSVYILFVIIQFNYLFSGQLADGFTYATYARRGFFELLSVTIINWTLLTGFLTFVKDANRGMKKTLSILYSLLILMSCIMLASAFGRLSLYEAAYGFTFDRIIAHAIMLFLFVVFAYTLIRVWIERISLMHFYLIVGLLFYTTFHVLPVEQIIVDKNMERYEQTGKIDVEYLRTLSYPGVEALITLYKEGDAFDEHDRVEQILNFKKENMLNEPVNSWQSYNIAQQKTKQLLQEIQLK